MKKLFIILLFVLMGCAHQQVAQNRVWCCCQGMFGGECCRWVNVCIGGAVMGCACK